MSRNFVALTILALAGALLLPDMSWAGPGGLRTGAIRAGGFRAPFIVHRNARAGILRRGPHGIAMGRHTHGMTRPAGRVAFHATTSPVATGVFTTSRVIRLHHRRYINGWVYPVTTASEAVFIGAPYDPSEAIPVYAPQPAAESFDTASPPTPRLSSARDENPDACRSERVTVPATEGEREITVIRC